MSCETNANKISSANVSAGIARTAAKRAYHRHSFWRGHGRTLRRAVKQWRSTADDAALLQARAEIASTLAKQASRLTGTSHPAGIARRLVNERNHLLLHPPRSLSVAERMERLGTLDMALLQLRREKKLSAAAFRFALIDSLCAENIRPPRSRAPVAWLPARPVGAETLSVSQSDPNQKIKTRYRLVDLAEPVLSNLPSGAVNPAYDQNLQPRRRDRAASTLQIDRISRTLSADALLKPNARWDEGAPIVNAEGMVESGNGRLLALRHAQAQRLSGYDAYRDALMSRAVSFGFDRSDVEGLENPILVRERLTDMTPTEQRRFVSVANSSGAARMGSAEQARADAALIPPAFFTDLHVADSDNSLAESLAKQVNRPLISRFFRLLPETERAALMDKRGRLSASGMQRLEQAMFVYALPGGAGERLSQLIYESGEAINRVGAGLKAALPKLGQLEDRIRAGHLAPAFRLGDDLAIATGKLRALQKQGLRVNDYLRQHQILPDITAFQAQLLVQLDARRKSARAVAELLNSYADTALQIPPPSQGAFFGAQAPTPSGIFRAALKENNGTWVDLSNWSAAQHTIAGFDVPAPTIQKLNRDKQKLGILVAANTEA